MRREMSSAAPGRLQGAGPTTSTFTLAEDRAARFPTVPPPPLECWLAGLVHRAKAADQRFRVRVEVEDRGFSGLFIGTYSAVPDAAPCRAAASGLYAAASRPTCRPSGWCTERLRACPMQVHFSTEQQSWRRELDVSAASVALGRSSRDALRFRGGRKDDAHREPAVGTASPAVFA